MDEVIKIKDLSPMHCVGYMGYDDEWHPDSRYRKHLKIDQHHYTVNIWREEKNKWKLSVYLGLTNYDARNILIIRQSAKTMKELKKLAVDEINSYHNTERCTKDIEDWKKSNGNMVFDKDFNYLGITYTSPAAEKRNTEYDYYNDKKPKVGYGTYYMLCENSVAVCKIGYGWSEMGWDKSEELRNKLLQNMPDSEV